MSDANSILNDQNYTPWTPDGVNLIATEDGTFVIFANSLPVHVDSTAYGKTRTWLRTPPRYLRGRGKR